MRTTGHTVVPTLPSGEQIQTIENHPFSVEGCGFTPAGELGIGTLIVTRAGPAAKLEQIERRAGPTKVYNFEVEDLHSYFVGAGGGGLWVHNAPCWVSPGGLTYETGSPQGNRLLHLFEHLAENPAKPTHSVFDVGTSQELLDLVDGAWLRRGAAEPGDPGAYVVHLGRRIGTAGQEFIRIIVRPGTSRLVTAYPAWGP